MLTKEHVLSAVEESLKEADGVLLVIVYGSAATDTMRKDSDVDVAILCRTALAKEEKLALSQMLCERLRREVDLVDLHTISGVLLKQILTKGKIVIKKDANAYGNLLQKMIYNQQDYMPYYHRALRERIERFVNG